MILTKDPFKIIRAGLYRLQLELRDYEVVLDPEVIKDIYSDIEELTYWLHRTEGKIYET